MKANKVSVIILAVLMAAVAALPELREVLGLSPELEKAITLVAMAVIGVLKPAVGKTVVAEVSPGDDLK